MADEFTSAYDIFQRPLGEGQARQPRLDRIGGGMDYSAMFQDPMAWASLLGTGLGVGSNIYSGIQQQQNYNDMLRQARQPFNWQQYYNPATDLEKAEMTRALKADLALRGVPADSMATSGAVASLLGRDALSRYQMALGPAQSQQEALLRTMGQFRGTPAMGDVSALPQYLAMMKLMGVRQNEQANQASQYERMMQLINRLYGGKEPETGQLYSDLQYQQPATESSGFQGDTMSPSELYSSNLDPNSYVQ